jgi:hypothetical protein
VSLAQFGGGKLFVGVSQCHEDDPPFESPEGSSVDACKTSEEVPTAFPGEAPYPVSGASSETVTVVTEPVTSLGILEGKCRYRPSYSRGDISTPLM